MSDIDTIRWGDAQTLQFFANAGEGGAGPKTTKQLIYAKWSRPLTWRVMVWVAPVMPAAGETATFTVTLIFKVGVGAAMIEFTQFLTFAPVAGAYSPQLVFFDMPAEVLMLAVQVDASNATQTTKEEDWTIGAWAAPRTEPGAFTELRDITLKALGETHRSVVSPDSQDLPRWMQDHGEVPPGVAFEDGELRYR